MKIIINEDLTTEINSINESQNTSYGGILLMVNIFDPKATIDTYSKYLGNGTIKSLSIKNDNNEDIKLSGTYTGLMSIDRQVSSTSAALVLKFI